MRGMRGKRGEGEEKGGEGEERGGEEGTILMRRTCRNADGLFESKAGACGVLVHHIGSLS